MKIVIDTDMSSAFAKTGHLELLFKLFQDEEIVITPQIYQELLTPLNLMERSK